MFVPDSIFIKNMYLFRSVFGNIKRPQSACYSVIKISSCVLSRGAEQEKLYLVLRLFRGNFLRNSRLTSEILEFPDIFKKMRCIWAVSNLGRDYGGVNFPGRNNALSAARTWF